MSVKEIRMFSLVCDGCGVDVNEDTDYAAYSDEDTSRDIARDCDWITTEDGKDWCPDCTEWDEEADERRPRAILPHS